MAKKKNASVPKRDEGDSLRGTTRFPARKRGHSAAGIGAIRRHLLSPSGDPYRMRGFGAAARERTSADSDRGTLAAGDVPLCSGRDWPTFSVIALKIYELVYHPDRKKARGFLEGVYRSSNKR